MFTRKNLPALVAVAAFVVVLLGVSLYLDSRPEGTVVEQAYKARYGDVVESTLPTSEVPASIPSTDTNTRRAAPMPSAP